MKSPRLAPLLVFLTAPLVHAQWSSDASVNLPLADSAGGQVQTKVVATADGGCYVSWFDAIGTGFDVRLQKLDLAGNELWAHNGVLVADRGLTSTQDYGLAVDNAGYALLAFRDDHQAFANEIVGARVSPDGVLMWGSEGALLSGGTTAFVASPRITSTDDGSIVAAWTQDTTAIVIGIDTSGTNQWTYRQSPGATGSYSVSDLHSAGMDVILSTVYQSGNFLSPRHLRAIKLDGTGAPTWPAEAIVFDGGSLQMGNFPPFTPDGNGGALFAWYGTAPLQCYVQHIRADGTQAYPHNGSPVSTNAGQIRVSPSLDYDLQGGNTYVYWRELNLSQSQFGLSGQKFDDTGVAQWDPQGVTLIPVGPLELRNVRTVANGGGAFVFWTEIPSFGADVLRCLHVDGAGVTDIPAFFVASTASGKSRPSADLGASGQAIIAWSDARNDDGDILAQNINSGGSLGNLPLGTSLCFGTGCPCGNDDNTAGCLNSTGFGARLMALGSTSVSGDNLLLLGSRLKPNGPALLFAGPNQVAGGAGQMFGDGLLCVSGSIRRLGTKSSDATGNSSWGPGLITSKGFAMPGDTRVLQIWYRDPVGGPCSSGFNTSHALELGFGQ